VYAARILALSCITVCSLSGFPAEVSFQVLDLTQDTKVSSDTVISTLLIKICPYYIVLAYIAQKIKSLSSA